MFTEAGWRLMDIHDPGAHHCSRPTQGLRTRGRPGERLQSPYRSLRLLQSPVGHPEKQRYVEGADRCQGTLQLLKGLHSLLRSLIDKVDDPLIKTRRIAHMMQRCPVRGRVRG